MTDSNQRLITSTYWPWPIKRKHASFAALVILVVAASEAFKIALPAIGIPLSSLMYYVVSMPTFLAILYLIYRLGRIIQGIDNRWG